ncbi:hypothetical protein, partial [Brachyspira hampsonii]|uniref:hypothetical protein n=1 Tax=Brachyspira hampsonii TaxID=1287055 RepID=UPI0015E733B3
LNNKEIKGISPEQRYEEALKLEIFNQYSNYKETILKIENDVLFKGRIKNIFLLAYSENNKDFIEKYNLHTKFFEETFFDKKENKLELNKNIISEEKLKLFDKLLEQYQCINENQNQIWGELLLEDYIYKYINDRIELKVKRDCAFLYLVHLYHMYYINNEDITINNFLHYNRKNNLNTINEELKKLNKNIKDIESPIKQLYIIYVLSYDNDCCIFKYINNNKQFGIYVNDGEKSDKVPLFEKKLLFQSYNISWGGAQPYVKLDSASDLSGLEKYLK